MSYNLMAPCTPHNIARECTYAGAWEVYCIITLQKTGQIGMCCVSGTLFQCCFHSFRVRTVYQIGHSKYLQVKCFNMGNCCESQNNFLTVIYAINGEAENGFAEYTSCNYPDILPVGEVNSLISGVNSAIQATKSQKKYKRLRAPRKCLALFACLTCVAFLILFMIQLLSSNCKVCGDLAGEYLLHRITLW